MSGSVTLTASPRAPGHAGRLMLVRCSAGRHDRPYPEEHDGWTVAVVRRGAFNYRAGDTNRARVAEDAS